MRKYLIVLSLSLCGVFLGMSAGGVGAEECPKELYVTPSAAQEWLKENCPIVWLDVRERDEFTAGHIPNAVNIPHDKVIEAVKHLPRDRPIVVYCIHSAHRAPVAAAALRHNGFTNAYVLEGGIVAWRSAGQSLNTHNFARAPEILDKTDRCQLKKVSKSEA